MGPNEEKVIALGQCETVKQNLWERNLQRDVIRSGMWKYGQHALFSWLDWPCSAAIMFLCSNGCGVSVGIE